MPDAAHGSPHSQHSKHGGKAAAAAKMQDHVLLASKAASMQHATAGLDPGGTGVGGRLYAALGAMARFLGIRQSLAINTPAAIAAAAVPAAGLEPGADTTKRNMKSVAAVGAAAGGLSKAGAHIKDGGGRSVRLRGGSVAGQNAALVCMHGQPASNQVAPEPAPGAEVRVGV